MKNAAVTEQDAAREQPAVGDFHGQESRQHQECNAEHRNLSHEARDVDLNTPANSQTGGTGRGPANSWTG
jgi:hypothetical protein